MRNTVKDTLLMTCLILALIVVAAFARADDSSTTDTTAEPLDTETVLEAIDVDSHEVPDLPLKKSSNYASSAVDVEPFGHVEPYTEHFLEQLEYTGPGRAKPEPESLDTVKIGFL